VPPRPDWRALAEEGQFERAYHGLSRRPLSEVSDEPGELLILADVARLSHHPAQAVPPLRKVVDAHPDDPRAPLAAFTMGRVLLDDLGQPKQAAAAFSRLQGLDPGGPMAEDALAREVEAWSRAGDVAQARRRAEDYLMRSPAGRRLRSVRRYGGLD
jgi:transmembrane sensor